MNIKNLCKNIATSVTLGAMGLATPGCVSVDDNKPHTAHVTTDAVRQMQEEANQSGKSNDRRSEFSLLESIQSSKPVDSNRTNLEQLAAAPEGTVIR